MALTQSSSDVIGFILEYLDAIAVLRLVECGNALLSAKIMQSCKNLQLRTSPFMKFPYPLFNFPNLTSLALLPHVYVDIYPLRLQNALPLPSKPVNSLLKLKLSFVQSSSVLRLENGSSLLSTYFPNLKSLQLAFGPKILTEDHMQALPSGLEDLTFEARSTPTLNSISLLLKLPHALKSLSLSIGNISTDATTKDYSSIVWPPGLASLTLHRVDPCMLQHLPPYLDHLTLWLSRNGGNPISSPIPTSILPMTLISVSITDMSFKDDMFIPTTFPTSLTRCNLPFYYASPKALDWTHLPKSLTELGISSNLKDPMPLIAQLPNLTFLPFHFQHIVLPNALLSSLPSKLIHFYQSHALLSSIPHLPSTLRSLKLKISPLSSASQTGNDAIKGDMGRLPPFLTRLEILNASNEHKFCKADFLLLPSTLHSLMLDLRDIEDIATLYALPSSLKNLSMSISPKTAENLISDSLLLNALPSGLKDLSLFIRMIRTEWRQWVHHIGRFHTLERLVISYLNLEANPDPISLEFIPTLPECITDLSLSIHQSNLTPELMRGLPKKLVSLTFRPVSGPSSSSSATDECFAHLPRSMVALHLPSDLQGLTRNFFNFIPHNLVQLSLPASISPHLSSFHAREPDWEGAEPVLFY